MPSIWFRISFAEKALLRRFAAAGLDPATAGVEDAFRSMVGFYLEQRAQHTRLDDDGDGLLLQWAARDGGLWVDLTRQLIRSGDDQPVRQLSLSFLVAGAAVVPTAGDRWFFDPAEPGILEEVLGSPAVRAARGATVITRTLVFDEA